ncbi:methyltransferase FkbM family [Pyrobaculum islandicum DSM 4184]|uniref:Methyltransferase FkbM family n=1 Tax=Pyrobaculum islandicum (strain DSM 4184 / JCM 9189 / GEO3) TaxID=384616 RepID=A1RUL5_PYRIL|nr:FkbM family methyltransferase [Pyrobaculum islandicum]ABL88647.1 methyltransferase FkbM family [Pyrobaculum islandicum DSM 4184]
MFNTFKLYICSNQLFKNWISAGIKFYLYKLNIVKADKIQIICKNGNKIEIPLSAYGRIILGYCNKLFKDFSCDNGSVILSDGSEVPAEEIAIGHWVLDAIIHGWRYSKEGYWYKDNIKFKHIRASIVQNFVYNLYKDIELNNKIVIDIGAFIGDTPILFIHKGAKKVIAIEPNPSAFKEMLINIELNNLNDKIIPINAAIGSKKGFTESMIINNQDIDSVSTLYYKPENYGNIHVLTLRDIIDNYLVKITENNVNNEVFVLRMDCEGCEYDIILNNYRDIKMFNEIIFEYHEYKVNKPVTMLLDKLKADYSCSLLNEEWFKKYSTNYPHEGLIKCVKVQQT